MTGESHIEPPTALSRWLKAAVVGISATAALTVVSFVLYFNYDVRAALASVQGDTPQQRVEAFMAAVLRGDEQSVMGAWPVPPGGFPARVAALTDRRTSVTKALVAAGPQRYSIESVEWWSMCCEPHIIDSPKYASGARYTVNIGGARYRIDAFARNKEAVYDGLPPSQWAIYDVYPVTEAPIYNTWPGR